MFDEYVNMARSNLAAFAPAVVMSVLKWYFSNDDVFPYRDRLQVYGESETSDYSYLDGDDSPIERMPLQIIEESQYTADLGSYPVIVVVKGQTMLRRVGMDDLKREEIETGKIIRFALAESMIVVNCFAPDRMAAEYLATSTFSCFHFFSDFIRRKFRLHDIEPSIIQRSQTVMGADIEYNKLGDLIPVQIKIQWPFTWGQVITDASVMETAFISFFGNPDDPLEEHPDEPAMETDP